MRNTKGEVCTSIFSSMSWKLHISFTVSLFLTGCSITGSIFSRRLSFLAGKSIRAYFIGKSVAFYGFFSYVGEYRIIKIPITYHFLIIKIPITYCVRVEENVLPQNGKHSQVLRFSPRS
jgi:hypothetical protein